ncbi:hypothetical protein GCM10023319_51120 [Nocardia iowensis]
MRYRGARAFSGPQWQHEDYVLIAIPALGGNLLLPGWQRAGVGNSGEAEQAGFGSTSTQRRCRIADQASGA